MNPTAKEFSFAGDFETHLTVGGVLTEEIDSLAPLAATLGGKLSVIHLSHGLHAVQPMLTFESKSAFLLAMGKASELSDRLRSAGFIVSRVKVEVSPWNQDVPQTDVEMNGDHAHRYFEHHIKLVVGTDELEAVSKLVGPFGGHLSLNARRRRTDGRHERFVTQRCYAQGAASAGVLFERLCDVIRSAGYEIAESEREFVVFDSNLGLDAGWDLESDRHKGVE